MFQGSDKPALLCVFADYFGLALIQPTLPFYLEDITPNIEIWTVRIIIIIPEQKPTKAQERI